MKPILFIAFFLVANIYYAQDGYKNIEGTLTDDKYNEAIVFADVRITSSDTSVFSHTDIDGKFHFDSLPDGNYSIKFSYEMSGIFFFDVVRVNHQSSATFSLDAKMHLIEVKETNPIVLISIPYPIPTNPTLTYREIQKCVNKYQLPALVQGISSNALGNEGELSLSGARKGDCLFLIDGVKCREMHQVPSASMESVTVISHFIPANYGDTTGGVISVKTMSYMDLYNERERQRLGFKN